ncbi:hypothetical protein HanIR_Chr09g0400871 [Helianthus annuus]|nr:hypothetical protein HanIR_Chr09g0400871 [Helianthus annuus]
MIVVLHVDYVTMNCECRLNGIDIGLECTLRICDVTTICYSLCDCMSHICD